MSSIVWKKFIVGELIERTTPPNTGVSAKMLDIKEEYFEDSIALITRAESNNGIRGYIEKGDFPTSINTITYNDQFTFFLYHNYEYTTIKDHLSLIIFKNQKVGNLFEKNYFLNKFLVNILNKAYSKEIFNFGFNGTEYKFDREIILLPLLETTREESIWEFDGKYYTLAVEYIENLVNKAKENIEERTINSYKQQKDDQINNSLVYKDSYCNQTNTSIWKSFSLGELFDFDSSNQLSLNRKGLDISPVKDEEYNIALITQTEQNNGVSGFLKSNDEINAKKMRSYLTYSMHFGLCFYHNYDFVLMDTHGSVFRLIPRKKKLSELLLEHKEINCFIAGLITKVCSNDIYNYGWLPNSSRVTREIILLPLLETTKEESVWEFDGKYYTLAIDVMSYLYYVGRINMYDKKIKNYKCVY